jgi:hypothetical protein
MEQSEIKIRPLTYKDRKAVSALFDKLAQKVGPGGIKDVIVAGTADSSGKQEEQSNNDVFSKIALGLIQKMIVWIESDVVEWFASLIGRKKEDFESGENLPFDVELIIIEQLMAAKESNDFFTRALRIYSKTSEYVRQARTEKAK